MPPLSPFRPHCWSGWVSPQQTLKQGRGRMSEGEGLGRRPAWVCYEKVATAQRVGSVSLDPLGFCVELTSESPQKLKQLG